MRARDKNDKSSQRGVNRKIREAEARSVRKFKSKLHRQDVELLEEHVTRMADQEHERKHAAARDDPASPLYDPEKAKFFHELDEAQREEHGGGDNGSGESSGRPRGGDSQPPQERPSDPRERSRGGRGANQADGEEEEEEGEGQEDWGRGRRGVRIDQASSSHGLDSDEADERKRTQDIERALKRSLGKRMGGGERRT